MRKMMVVLLFLIFVSTKLCSKPVGLENCGGTCFQNAAIQMVYQIDSLVSLLSVQQDFYTHNTPEYIFQHLVWDMLNAQQNDKSFIECGSVHNPTNLKKLTEGMYECMNLAVGDWGDLGEGLNILLQKLKKTTDSNLISVLNMVKESILHPPNIEPYTIPRLVPTTPFIVLDDLSGPQDLKNYINKHFITKKKSWLDPRPGGIVHENVSLTYKLFFAPNFIFFAYQVGPGEGFGHLKNTFFPDELNLTRYVKGNAQAIYQLRAIGVHTGNHYFAVVRDRDGKLYKCNDSNITHINNWQEGIRAHNPAAFLYVLKTTKQDFSGSDILLDKLNKLKKSLKNLERAIKKTL